MRKGAALVAVASALAVACGGLAVGGRSPGEVPCVVELDSVGDAVEPRRREDLAAAAQGAADLRCPPDAVTARPLRSLDTYHVTGCGRGGVFCALHLTGAASQAGGRGGRVDLRRFVDVSDADVLRASLATLDRHAEQLLLAAVAGEPPGRPRVGEVERIALAGALAHISTAARDLSCARGSVVVYLDPAWTEEHEHDPAWQRRRREPPRYVAEGCGCKATYRAAGADLEVISRTATEGSAASACPPIAPASLP